MTGIVVGRQRWTFSFICGKLFSTIRQRYRSCLWWQTAIHSVCFVPIFCFSVEGNTPARTSFISGGIVQMTAHSVNLNLNNSFAGRMPKEFLAGPAVASPNISEVDGWSRNKWFWVMGCLEGSITWDSWEIRITRRQSIGQPCQVPSPEWLHNKTS